MKIISGKCRVCGRELQLQIDDDYSELGDPYKLLDKATCNRCYDHLDAQKNIEAAIAQQAAALQHIRHGVKRVDELARLEEKCRINLVELTRKFCKIECDHRKKPFAWEPSIVDSIMKRPDFPYTPLNNFKRTCSFNSPGSPRDFHACVETVPNV